MGHDSEYDTYHYEYCNPKVWARPEADRCGCRGSGWWLSEADVWYQCSHHTGPHPEHEDEETTSAREQSLREMAEQASRELNYSCRHPDDDEHSLDDDLLF